MDNKIVVRGLNVFYESVENATNGGAILLLHGWGASSKAMRGIFLFLSRCGYNVLSLDLPGFGDSDTPPQNWGIYDYADFVQEFLESVGAVKPIVLGHSFGGRVAIILAARKKAKRVALVDAAGIKPKFSLAKKMKIVAYKIAKRFGRAPKNAGSQDYRALSADMKKVFVRVVNTSLEKEMESVTVECLLIWGKLDKETPLYMAKKMQKLIKNSGLVILENSGHFPFADEYKKFCLILKSFLESE